MASNGLQQRRIVRTETAEQAEPKPNFTRRFLFGFENSLALGCLLIIAFTLSLLLSCATVWCAATMCLQ